MNRVLHRIAGSPGPAPDGRWVGALFAELAVIDSQRGRLLWLLGAAGLIAGHYTRRCTSLLTPISFICVIATVVFGVMAFTEYEGLAVEDDWYPLITAAFAAALICVSLLNLRRQTQAFRP